MDALATRSAYADPSILPEGAPCYDDSRPVEPAPSAFHAANVMRIASTDADELAEALLDWNVELAQLRPGRFDSSVTIIPLGPVLICQARYNQSLLQHTSPPDDCISINRPARGSDPLTFNGHDVEEGEVFVSGPGAAGESVNRGLQIPTTLSVKIEFLQAQSQWLNYFPMPETSNFQLHSPGTQWTGVFLDAIAWILDAATRYPEAMARSDIRGSLVDALLDRVNTLGATGSPVSGDCETRASRRVAVERAREYIRANLTDPIRLSDLCKHARTQARSLEYGFREVMGISPIAYVRASRLHRTRRLLRSTAVRTRSISEIALDCGFWHLSQFAVDYKLLFSESPSVTYRRTQAELPPVERRRASAAVSTPPRSVPIRAVHVPAAVTSSL